MRERWLKLFVPVGMVCLWLSAAASGQTPGRQKAEVKTVERRQFVARGEIQILDSYGEVKVEGWDRPEVEVAVTKTTQKEYEPGGLARAVRDLERIKVELESSENSLLVIRTIFPPRTPARMLRGKTNANLRYVVKVPRQSSLTIKHDVGRVEVADLDGDLEATNGVGEISLRLPGENQYAVDARAKIGDVSSEFGDTAQRQRVIGASLLNAPVTPTRRLFLRVGVGAIQIEKMRE
jgi:hypothetical protein